MTATFKTSVRILQPYVEKRCVKITVSDGSHLETTKITTESDTPKSQEKAPPVQRSHHPEKVKPSAVSMSTEFKTLPFAYTDSDQVKEQKVNDILASSLRQQKDDEISDSTGFVVILVHRCLGSVGIDSQVVCGCRSVKEDSRLPHIWLVIDDKVIDNTYCKDLPPENVSYLCQNTPNCYNPCDYSSYNDLNITDKSGRVIVNLISSQALIKRVRFYMAEPDRALALGLNQEQVFNYYFSMIRHMYDAYGVCITGVDPKLRIICWGCGCYPKLAKCFFSDIMIPSPGKDYNMSKTVRKFSHCSHCMVANYCSLDCQKSDWADNHCFTCISRGSVCVPPLGSYPFPSDTVASTILTEFYKAGTKSSV